MQENETNEVIKKIMKRREELGYSYQDLADRTGLNKSTLMRYEKGIIKNLSLDKLEIIAKALNISSAYLMGWEEEKKINPLETLAAHFDGEEFTKDDIDDIENFIKYVQSKKNK
jgi:HTH-type transcriptional regulator, cell division transcriptional repressor